MSKPWQGSTLGLVSGVLLGCHAATLPPTRSRASKIVMLRIPASNAARAALSPATPQPSTKTSAVPAGGASPSLAMAPGLVHRGRAKGRTAHVKKYEAGGGRCIVPASWECTGAGYALCLSALRR